MAHKGPIEKKLKPFDKVLREIEMVCAQNEWDLSTEEEKAWSQLFRMFHAINAPSCRKNHPRWTGEAKKLLVKLWKRLE